MGIASAVQSDFGNVDVSEWYFETGGNVITYKLYVPKSADAASPAPGVLLMHGYQNDKETNAAYAIELARRGIVALSIDEYGHGSTSVPMRARGYTHYALKDLNTRLNGPERYLTMLNFSTLDFFNGEISGGIADSSMGGAFAYSMLGAFDFVDETRLGVTGHSMGTWSSWTEASRYPNHKAVVLQCGEVFPKSYYDTDKYTFNNVLLLQARYDEFENFRDYRPATVDGLEHTPLRYADFMGQSAPVEWNRTYGAFEDGSARRMELLNTNHRLTTHDSRAVAAACAWFAKALDVNASIAPENQIFLLKECFVLLGLLAALGSTMPLLCILLKTRLFAGVAQPMPQNTDRMLTKKSWRKNVLITILLSGLTYPFLTQLGHGLIPVPEDIFRMTIGNGFITWLSFLMLAALIMLLVWYKRGGGKKLGITLYDLGLARESDGAMPACAGSGLVRGESDKQSGTPEFSARFALGKVKPEVVLKSLLLAVILVGALYLFTTLSVLVFKLDFRFIWPFFKPFTIARLGQFFVYLPFYLAFFLINGGAKLYGQLRRPDKNGQISLWLRSSLIMLGGVLIIVLLEYIPFFAGIGPGADLLFSSTFGGPFMSIMILMIPQFLLFFFLSTYYYRKTGLVYVGSIAVAMLAAWVVTGGSAFF